jgi:hypothetical protein
MLRQVLTVFIIAAVLLSPTATFADKKKPAPPRAFHAATYPARETHDQEKVTIAADPYDMPDKAKVFEVPYKEIGFLPIHIVISNDGGDAVVVTNAEIQLITVDRVKISPALQGDVSRRLVESPGRQDKPNPFPWPQRKKKDMAKLAEEEIDTLGFHAKAVEPNSTQAGFVFFDVSGLKNPLAGAYLMITGLKNSEGGELFYFEIPLEKYLSYRPPSSTR